MADTDTYVPTIESDIAKDWKPAPVFPLLKKLTEPLTTRKNKIISITLLTILSSLAIMFSETEYGSELIFVSLAYGILNIAAYSLVIFGSIEKRVDENGLTSDEYAAKQFMDTATSKLLEVGIGSMAEFAERAVPVPVFEAEVVGISEDVQPYLWHITVGDVILGCVAVRSCFYDELDEDTWTLDTEVMSECVTVHLFGEPLIFISANYPNEKEGAEFVSEIETCEGFYQIIRDESLREVIGNMLYTARRPVYNIYIGDMDDREAVAGGPATDFIAWLLTLRAEGHPFKAS